MINKNFWNKKRVFLTGHTGFKGSWLSIWLSQLGADVTGYALQPPTNPSLFDDAHISDQVHSIIGDIADLEKLKATIQKSSPEIVFHFAAQPLVRESYINPVETYRTNVMGTVNLLEAVRFCPSVRSVVIITTDKCYENKEWIWPYRENEPMGGYDPYSSSKGCAELVVSAYRRSFFNPDNYSDHNVGVASARAGNVIGGGDWAADRIVPDCMRALIKNEPVVVRNPGAVRPWQHVLEPLSGYMVLAQKLWDDGPAYADAWNFGPHTNDTQTVEKLVTLLCSQWGDSASYEFGKDSGPHEAGLLQLDSSKAHKKLGWHPRWNVTETVERIVEWYKAYSANGNINDVCIEQINSYNENRI
ncbi:MAG: CDP-glucose 4,6-dehydratase [Chitinivibrionales bacterium]|nr:CDP-glucose 4,6-dehydratase [Chitinivibrionales bacterium]